MPEARFLVLINNGDIGDFVVATYEGLENPDSKLVQVEFKPGILEGEQNDDSLECTITFEDGSVKSAWTIRSALRAFDKGETEFLFL